MVDSEEEPSSNKSLVERLEEAPKKFFDVMTATSKNYLTHIVRPVAASKDDDKPTNISPRRPSVQAHVGLF